MGSRVSNLLGKAPCRGIVITLLIFGAAAATAHATGESILLPGYVRQNPPPVVIGNQPPPTILPGWASANPGFVPTPNPSGLKLIVDNTWPDLPGYRMIRLEFMVNKPALEERRLRVQIRFQNSNYSRAEMSVTSAEIVIPAGQSAVKHQLYYPSQQQQYIREIRTTEDGERWPDLSCDIYSSQQTRTIWPFLDLTPLGKSTNSSASSYYAQGTTGTRATADQISQGSTQGYRNGATYSYPINHGWSGIPSYADLPNNPLGYDCFEVVLCTAAQLTELKENHAPQWQALRSWVAMGGTLLVFPKDGNSSASVRETQLQLDELFSHGELSEKNTPAAAWNKHNISTIPQPIQRPQQNVYYDDGLPSSSMPSSPTPITGGLKIDFPERAWFQGTLAVLPSEQNFDAIYSHLQNSTQQPLPSTPLPLVGLPPITMFQILITLFVIFIGPVNYFYFKKKKKMNWLLITVPAGALAITGLLLAYTLFKDGIGVRSWSQSYTVLDQVQKSASTRQQFCLFAGITPGDGLRFRSQTIFDDLSEDQTNNYGYRYRDIRSWEYSWDQTADESSGAVEQHLRSGWLPARTLKVYETCDFNACQRQLQIQTTGESCQLVNKLGAKVLTVYVADGERVWSTTNIAEDGSASANLVNDTTKQNLKTTLEQDLFSPASSFEASDRHGLLPQDRTVQERFLGLRRLHPRVFLAVVEHWPELQSGIANPTVESWGPHVILGVW